jgi:hypothetical protein
VDRFARCDLHAVSEPRSGPRFQAGIAASLVLSPRGYLAIPQNKNLSPGLNPPSYSCACRSTRGRFREASAKRDRRAVAGECEMRGARRTPRSGGPSCRVPMPRVGVTGLGGSA